MNTTNLLTDKYIVQVFGIGLTIIGLIGNSIVLYIFTRPKFLKESIYRYFIISEVFATVSILLFWIHVIPAGLKWNVPISYCKIFLFILYTIYDFYPWISVQNSIDRYLTLKYPSKFRIIKKFTFQILSLSTTFALVMITNIPRVLYGGTGNLTLCLINNADVGFYMNLYNLAVSNLIPFILMICSTFLIFHYMITQKRKLQKNMVNFQREKNFIKNVLIMNLWFLCCYSPFCIVQFLRFSIDFPRNDSTSFLINLTIILSFVDITCNFFVYLCCNKLFRSYFFLIIGCRNVFQKSKNTNGRGSTNIIKTVKSDLSVQNINLSQLK